MKPSECLMIGDIPDDIKAGKAAGTVIYIPLIYYY